MCGHGGALSECKGAKVTQNSKLDVGHLKRQHLANFPTCLTAIHGFDENLNGTELLIKRDDLIDFGFGGNKVRGLEFILGDAKQKGADTLITGAGVLSNHVRATAAAAAYAGLGMVAVYWGEEPKKCEGNHLLSRILGAEMHFTGSSDRSSVDRHMEKVAEDLRRAGRHPYCIPRGGACALGVIGHILAVEEVAVQCRAFKTAPERVILAVGSGSTMAGWILGSQILGLDWQIEGYTVSRSVEEVRVQVHRLALEAAKILGLDLPVSNQNIVIHDGVIGEGYGIPSPEGQRAIVAVARRQGIFFDPTYTGKAFAGMMKDAARGKFSDLKSILFLHTGGAPSIFTSGIEIFH
jgi:D-cysteine desulfhydrase family pyridoxal phosphate-dependent enzyme